MGGLNLGFLAFASAIDVEVREVVVVGDTVYDLTAAHAAGATAIGVRTGPAELLTPYADALIDPYETVRRIW